MCASDVGPRTFTNGSTTDAVMNLGPHGLATAAAETAAWGLR